jgi:predicted cation transporter
MTAGLLIILALVLFLPFTIKTVEHNLEYFLFIMGLSAAAIAGSFTPHTLLEIMGNPLLYFITLAVLVTGLLFSLLMNKVKEGISVITQKLPFPLFIFLVIVVLGLASSIITAIIASLVLVEIVHVLPLKHKAKLRLAVTACISIGLGAALTPVGEPLATIAVTKLDTDFWYLLNQLGIFIIPGIISLGVFGAFYVRRDASSQNNGSGQDPVADFSEERGVPDKVEVAGNGVNAGNLGEVFIRAFKIFIFIIALELLGIGFKPLIENFVVNLDSVLLYWINMVSAVLDNATIAAAEISPAMSALQVKAVLMGLLVSGGMLIPGNIPNIVAAGKLKIKSREWAKIGIPLGLVCMAVYFVIIFLL